MQLENSHISNLRDEFHSCVRIDYLRDIITWLMYFPLLQHQLFLPTWVGNDKCTSPSAIQVKNWRKTISTAEKLDAKSQLKKGGGTVPLAHSSILQFVIMLIEVQKMLVRNESVYVARLPQSYQNELYQKWWLEASYICTALKINKYTAKKYMHMQRNVYTLYIKAKQPLLQAYVAQRVLVS